MEVNALSISRTVFKREREREGGRGGRKGGRKGAEREREKEKRKKGCGGRKTKAGDGGKDIETDGCRIRERERDRGR